MSRFEQLTQSTFRIAANVLVALTLTLAAQAQAEVYYKWQDANGNWIYGATAPRDVNAIEVRTSSGKNAQRNQNSQEVESDPALSANAGVDMKLCKQAKSNLESLNSGAVIQLVNEDGESVTLDAEQMEQEREKAKAAIQQFCLGFSS